MRLGIIISVVIVLVLGLMLLILGHSSLDNPTRRTRPERLEAASLDNLSPIFATTEADSDATARYEKAVQYYLHHQTSLQRDPKDTETVELTELLIEAMRAGKLRKGLLDDFVPLKPGQTPSFDDALEAIPMAVLSRAEKLRDKGSTDSALIATQAVWAFGQRLFQYSDLLFNRRSGLMMMTAAGDSLFPMADRIEGGSKTLQDWSAKLTSINEQWQEKVEVVAVVRPHIGDLMNLARNDKDRTFRIEATKQMAVAKFNPGSRGNEKAVAAYLEEAQKSDDKLVAEAAKAASAFTVEELRKLR